MDVGGSWSTQQLVEFLSAVSSCSDEHTAVQAAVERAAAALDAEVSGFVRSSGVVASVGFAGGSSGDHDLIAVARGDCSSFAVAGAGQCAAIAVPVEDGESGCLVVARSGDGGFTWTESSLLRGMGRAFGMSLRALRLLEQERALRQDSQRRADEALHDPLTGLPNRSMFTELLRECLSEAKDGRRLGLLFIDLDRFKFVNESLGHASGDQLLVAVADRLRGCVRERDMPSRLGGDEFAVFVDGVQDDADLVVLAERVMASFAAPIHIGEQQVAVTASIGIAVASAGDTGAIDLMRDADVAMYSAKAQGKGRYAWFEKSMQEGVRFRMELEVDLRRAIERDEIDIAYQPIIDLASGRTVGAEALARWVHPTHGPISPAEFIPLAEDTGLIIQLGKSVLERACVEAASWPASNPCYISVNISPLQLLDPRITFWIAAATDRARLDPRRLVLEITEQSLMERTEQTRMKLRALKATGLRLAVDDFGTGYSSLSYLARFPVDILKIDKSFIDAVANRRAAADLAGAIVKLGQSLGVTTLAEGIETASQREMMKTLGCDHGQGYLFSKPVDAVAFRALLGARSEPVSQLG